MKNTSRCTGGGVWASQQMITEQQNTEGEKTGAGDEQADHRPSGLPGHNQGALVPGTEGKEEEIQTHSPSERVNEDTNTASEEERERERRGMGKTESGGKEQRGRVQQRSTSQKQTCQT